MNKLKAKISDIQSVENLNIVNFNFNNQTLSMVSLDLDDEIKIGTMVELSAKSTHIAIAKEFSGELSYSNQIKATIVDINNGQLLSSIKAISEDTLLESVITSASSSRMNLKNGDKIILLIKATELSIAKVIK